MNEIQSDPEPGSTWDHTSGVLGWKRCVHLNEGNTVQVHGSCWLTCGRLESCVFLIIFQVLFHIFLSFLFNTYIYIYLSHWCICSESFTYSTMKVSPVKRGHPWPLVSAEFIRPPTALTVSVRLLTPQGDRMTCCPSRGIPVLLHQGELSASDPTRHSDSFLLKRFFPLQLPLNYQVLRHWLHREFRNCATGRQKWTPWTINWLIEWLVDCAFSHSEGEIYFSQR